MKNLLLLVVLAESMLFGMTAHEKKVEVSESLSVTVNIYNAENQKVSSSITVKADEKLCIGDLKKVWLKYKRMPLGYASNLHAVQHAYQVTNEEDILADDKKLSTIPGIQKWGIILYFKKIALPPTSIK